MEYGDEENIKRLVEAQAKKRHTIHNNVTINGASYTFAQRVFNLGFSMTVPESFEEMPPDIAKQKFPNENRPEIIISNSDYTVCLTFGIGSTINKKIEDRIELLRGCINRMFPSSVFFIQEVSSLPNGLTVGMYDYRFSAIDEDIYMLNFVIDLPDAELMGSFICPAELKEKWEPLARQMIASIEVVQ